jgi:hypothetical protein
MNIYIQKNKHNELINEVCKYSILSKNENASIKFLNEAPIIDDTLFKFLIPATEDYTGWALYCSNTLLFIDNVESLFSIADSSYAVMKVIDNKTNSLLLWNCEHPALKKLEYSFLIKNSINYINNFEWLDSELIGSLNLEWCHDPYNVDTSQNRNPKVVDFSEGGPWDSYTEHVAYGAVWERTKNEYLQSLNDGFEKLEFQNIPPEIKSIFLDILKYRVDPNQEYHTECNLENIVQDLKMINNNAVYAVDGGWNPDEKKGLVYDPYMSSFILGSGGQITNYDKVEESMIPCLFRGITKMKHMKACEAVNRDYYYIDTGYFGNIRKKLYHRITKNAMQNIGPVIERPFDRLEATGWRRRKFRPGKNILLCPPSSKAMSCFGLDLNDWMEETINTIKQYTDRPIVVRKKLSRRERTASDTIEMALGDDVHCLVTYNSIAATEALLLGKPAFTLGPNAAHSISLQDLSKIEKPYIPEVEELEAWAAHLAYCQFTEAEMRDGTAWSILNDNNITPE